MNYLNNTDLLYHLILSKGYGYPTKELSDMLILIINGVYLKFKDKNPDDIEDMRQQAFITLYTNWNRFDERKYFNGLAYLTEVSKRAYLSAYNELHGIKYRDKKKVGIQTISIHRFFTLDENYKKDN
jgi:hypothetical protein